MTTRNILCMKWGSLYSADYVNVLYSACRKAMKTDFRFICMTDDATGLNDGIEHHPIPDIGLLPQHWRGGGWPKISVFKPGLFDMKGRALFIDLDMLVLRDLDAMFDLPHPFVATDMGPLWGDMAQYAKEKRLRPEPGTCIFAFDIGAEDQIFERFTAGRDRWVRDYNFEQQVIGFNANTMDYWPDGWVLSFKRHLRRPIGLDLLQPPAAPPESAKVLAFHGNPRPFDLVKSGIWGRAPHLGRGPVDWMRRYWIENGGRI